MGRVIVGVVGMILLAVTACTESPPQPSPPTDRIPGLALTETEAVAVAADYDNRNNAAIASTVKASSDRPWNDVDTGPSLAADRFFTAVAWNGGARLTPLRITFIPKATWANPFTSYPIWAITRVGVQYEPTPPPGSADELLVVFRREAASAPWLAEMTMQLMGVPNLPDDRAGTTTPADVDAAATTMNELVAFLEQGTRPDFYITPVLDDLRDLLSVPKDDAAATSATCRPFAGTTSPRDSLRVVRSASGVLSVMTVVCRQTTTAKPGHTITRPAGFAKALGVPDTPATTLTQSWAVMVAVSRPIKGRAVAVAADFSSIRSDGP
ncbi:MAG: hypothetical protein ABI890_10040 [Lapillicoccus sp.]